MSQEVNEDKLYPLFLKKLKNIENKEILNGKKKPKDSQDYHRIVISFETLENRDTFLCENEDFSVLDTFQLIPSVISLQPLPKIKNLSKNPLIRRIEEDQVLHLNNNDIGKPLGLNRLKTSQFNFTGKNVNIGIIDTKIQSYYESFYQSKLRGHYRNQTEGSKKNYRISEDISHGTLIANILINQLKNRDEIRLGIAPDANIYDLSISNNRRKTYFSDIIMIFDRISEDYIPLDIILISFSTSEPSDGEDILSNACNLLIEQQGIIIVAPAGNIGPKPASITSPGAASKVITVGSLEENGKISKFSARGPTLSGISKPDIYFPGAKIGIKLERNHTFNVSGTSIAAAIATGIIALIKEYDRGLETEEIKEIFSKYQRDYSRGIDLPRLFNNYCIYSPKLVPYKYLLKRSIWISIQIIIILLLVFFWKDIYNLIRIIYGF
jgi:serine protease AprX